MPLPDWVRQEHMRTGCICSGEAVNKKKPKTYTFVPPQLVRFV